MDELKILDEVAYVRFASVYREFKDVSTFMDELKKILKINSIWNGNAESVRLNNEYWMKKELLIKQ